MTHDHLPDHYAVLGVAATASPAEITHAYRRRVRSQHPDIHSDTPQDTGVEELSAVVAAYAVLRDPARRADYDHQRQFTTTISTPPAPSSSVPPATQSRRPEPLLRVGPVRYHGPPHREHREQ
jgi:curved DNA-binding protein CbpA